jgi:hypothetical protein
MAKKGVISLEAISHLLRKSPSNHFLLIPAYARAEGAPFFLGKFLRVFHFSSFLM